MAEKENKKPAKTKLTTNQLKAIVRSKLQPILKKHALIAFIILSGFIIYALFTVNQTLLSDTELDTSTIKKETISISFDEQTIEKVQSLKNRSQSTDLSLPSGDINPFTN